MVSSTDGQWRRLAALAGMLGSEHDGERANAARLATQELRRLGLTWSELIARAFSLVKVKPQAKPKDGDYWAQQNEFQWEEEARKPRQSPGQRSSRRGNINLWDWVVQANQRREQLSNWDVRFVQTFLDIGPKCQATEAQWRQVERISEKLELAA